MRLILAILAASAAVMTTANADSNCLTVIGVTQCVSQSSADVIPECAGEDESVYVISTDPTPAPETDLFQSGNPTLKIGSTTVRGCDRSENGRLVCTIPSGLLGTYRLSVFDTPRYRRQDANAFLRNALCRQGLAFDLDTTVE